MESVEPPSGKVICTTFCVGTLEPVTLDEHAASATETANVAAHAKRRRFDNDHSNLNTQAGSHASSEPPSQKIANDARHCQECV
jgi:hypothetical protein